MVTAGRWLRRLGPERPEAARLVIVPYAGGGAIPYRAWTQALSSVGEVWALTPPGREARLDEPALRDWATWLAAAAGALDALADRPLALWGHSLGGLGAFELARTLGPGRVDRLIVSGCRPPSVVRWDDPDDLSDDDMIVRLRSLGGTPAEVLASPEIMALVMPLLRADFKLAATYRQAEGDALTIPVWAFAGLEDRIAPASEAGAWREVTRGAFTQVIFPGDHFFPFAGGAAPAVIAAMHRALGWSG